MKTASPQPPLAPDYRACTEEQLQEAAAQLACELSSVRAELAVLSTRAQGLCEQQRAIAEIQAQRLLDRATAPDWVWLLTYQEPESSVQYKAAQQAIADLGRCGQRDGLRMSGYNPYTMQRSFRVSLTRHCPELTAQVLSGLQTLLPFVTPFADGDKPAVKHVGVFEQSLSEHGSYSLAIDEARGVYELRMRRYGSPRTVHQAASLSELLTYVENHCFYDDARDA